MADELMLSIGISENNIISMSLVVSALLVVGVKSRNEVQNYLILEVTQKCNRTFHVLHENLSTNILEILCQRHTESRRHLTASVLRDGK